jgi:hypothetical protein
MKSSSQLLALKIIRKFNFKMFKILFLIAIFALKFASADLIGYNRLGNNVKSHQRFRSTNTSSYKAQMIQFMMTNTDLSNDERKSILSTLTNNTVKTPARSSRRLNHYNRIMV